MRTSRPADAIWWLNPFWVLVPPLLLTPAAAAFISRADYQLCWRVPKFFEADDMLLCWGVAAAFATGCAVALMMDHVLARGGAPVRLPSAGGKCEWWSMRLLFFLSLGVAVLAHALWFALIVKQTGFGIFRDVLRSSQGSMDELIRLRKDASIAGVTSFTQAGIAVGMIGVFLGVQTGWRTVRWPMALLLGMILMRAVFLAERLALIEVALPAVALWLRLRGLRSFSRTGRWLVLGAPLLGAAALYVLFTFGESFRSWNFYSQHGEHTLLGFSLVRLSGYYVTALNNGALLWQELGARGFPYSTLGGLWKFPLIGVPLRSLSGGSAAEADDAMLVIVEDGNAEFNNPSGIFVVFTDFGIPGAMVFWVCYGVVAMLLYRANQRGTLAGLFLYPFFFMALSDQLRTFYVSGGRTFVAWAVLIAAIVVARRDLQRMGTRERLPKS